MMTKSSQYKLITDIAKIAGCITGDIIPVREAEGVRDGTREFCIEDVAYLTEMLGWLTPYQTRTFALYPRPGYLPLSNLVDFSRWLDGVFSLSEGGSTPIGINSGVVIPASLKDMRKWTETTTDASSSLVWSLVYDLLSSVAGLTLTPALDISNLQDRLSVLRFTPLKSADLFRDLYKVLKPLNRFYWRYGSRSVFEKGFEHYVYATDPDEVTDLAGSYYQMGHYGWRAYQLKFRWRSGSEQRFIETYRENCAGEISFNRPMKNVTAVVAEHVFERIADPGRAASSSTPNNNWERVFTVPLAKIGTDGLKWRLVMPAVTRSEMRSRIEAVSGRSLSQLYPGTSYQVSSPSSRAASRLTAVLEYDVFGYFGDLGWECDFHSLPWTGE